MKFALVAAFCALLCAQTAILRLRVVEGDGIVHTGGSRATRPVTVEVTDETGQPVEGAAVSFHLPDEGPSGVFSTGIRTEIVLTGRDGRASVRGFRLNQNAGPFELRITASKDLARAAVVSPQVIADSGGAQAKPRSNKWLVVGLVAAGAGGGALAASLGRSGGRPAALATAAAPPVVLSVGAPVITVGKP